MLEIVDAYKNKTEIEQYMDKHKITEYRYATLDILK